MALSDGDLVDLLHDTADAIAAALGRLADWGLAGTRAGQHHSDLAADEAATRVLARADVGVMSEESGVRQLDREVVVVVDPLDGSTNAARGIPWYAISLCAVDQAGLRVALVVDLPRQRQYQAVRGAGAWVDRYRYRLCREETVDVSEPGPEGEGLHPSGCTQLSEAIVGLSGLPSRWLGWRQYRALGAVALDLCSVAQGTLDGYIDCWSHGPWDYMAGLLICREAGAVVGDAEGRELVDLDPTTRRTPLAAATPTLFDEIYRQVHRPHPPRQ